MHNYKVLNAISAIILHLCGFIIQNVPDPCRGILLLGTRLSLHGLAHSVDAKSKVMEGQVIRHFDSTLM